MIPALVKLHRLLTPRERRAGLALGLMMAAAAALEVLGVAAIPAFVSAVIGEERLRASPLAGGVLDALGLHDTAGLVLWGAAALLGVFAAKTAFLVFNAQRQWRFISAVRDRLARRLLHAYMAAPFSFHLQHNSAELLRNVERETGVIAQQVIGALLELCTRLLILAAVLAFLLAMEPLITVFWLALFGSLAAFAVLSLGDRLKRQGLEEQAERKAVVQALYQGLGAIKEARVLGRERFFAEKVGASIARLSRALARRQTAAKAIAPVTELAAVSGLLALAVGLVFSGRDNDAILVTLSLFVVGLVRLKETMSAAMTHGAALRYNLVSIDPVHDDLARLARVQAGAASDLGFVADAPAGPAPERRRLQEALTLHGVCFRYDGAAGPALCDVSLSIPAGAAVGFVGSTGAGKSTLLDVILGLLEPHSGAVRIDGERLTAANAPGWRRSIGYVPQAIYLLDDSIRRNIALGVPDGEIDALALQRTVRTAQLEPLLERLPAGLETVVGEQGARLSGGERQRIGIARALYRDPDVLILDEATSALDNATERAIIEAVSALRGRRTLLMIAHRLSTVRACDTLYFLKHGRIEAQGGFEQLCALNPEFAAMARAA